MNPVKWRLQPAKHDKEIFRYKIFNTSRGIRKMDLLRLSLPLAVGIAAIGSGLGLGRAIEGAMSAMGRQPEAIGKIQTAMLIGCAFIEALTIYALVVGLLLMGKIE